MEADPARRRSSPVPFVGLVAVTIAVWLALVRLGWAFATEQLDWRYVAEQSRVGAPWPYRVAGVWGGMEGSLLLFAGIVGVAAHDRRAPGRRRRCAGPRWRRSARSSPSTSLLASPFGRLDVPARRRLRAERRSSSTRR